jgi:hypothetical protein
VYLSYDASLEKYIIGVVNYGPANELAARFVLELDDIADCMSFDELQIPLVLSTDVNCQYTGTSCLLSAA